MLPPATTDDVHTAPEAKLAADMAMSMAIAEQAREVAVGCPTTLPPSTIAAIRVAPTDRSQEQSPTHQGKAVGQ